MHNKKPLMLDDVKRVFTQKLKDNSKTTTLDVKKALRDEDYYAEQEKVSGYMAHVAEEEGIAFVQDGDHRVYLDASIAVHAPLSSAVPPRVVSGVATAAAPDDTEQIADHFVWHIGQTDAKVRYMQMTRHQARYAFARMHAVPYEDTRSKRIKED